MQALRAADLLRSMGVNTHIGNAGIAPQWSQTAQTIAALRYLGIDRLRDMAGGGQADYEAVATAIEALFAFAISETAPQNYQGDLDQYLAMVIDAFALEGPNEPDAAYSVSLGGSPAHAASFMPTLYAAAQKHGLIGIANSFGIIWPDPGSYGTTGDLSSSADWGNAHTYYDPHQCSPNGDGLYGTGMIDWVQRNARMTTPGKPVAHTEFGWRHDRNSEAAIAAYTLTFFLSVHAMWGCPFAAIYSLFDDSSGAWGLFDGSGKPRQVATAIHNLRQMLRDDAPDALRFIPGAVPMLITGMPAGENGNCGGHSALYQKSNGEYWLALWNEQTLTSDDPSGNKPITVAPVPITVVVGIPLPNTVGLALLYDPLLSANPIRSFANTATFHLSLPAHPILLRLL
jgi:hypothetical protein